MRKTSLYAICGLLFVACNHLSEYHQQLKEVESVIESYPDSAWKLLGRIPATLLCDGEEKAMYNLLLTEATYKLYKPFKDDSLICYSVAFYKKERDQKRLATALYYQAAVWCELGNKEKSIFLLKQAQELAEKANDELLKNKIYEFLYCQNTNTHNHQLSIKYAHLFLESSKKLGNRELIVRSYDYLATDNNRFGMSEKATLYRDSSLQYLEKCEDWIKAQIYSNYADNLIKSGETGRAKDFLQKAVKLNPQANEYIMLGIISIQNGDTLNAQQYWEKAIILNEPRFSINAYKYLTRTYIGKKDYKRALLMLARADSINISYQEQTYAAQLAAIQNSYDNVALEKVLTEQKNRWLSIAFIALAAFVIALFCILYFRKRNMTYKGIINKNIEHIYQNEQKIKLLESQGQEFEQERETLREQVEKMRKATIQTLGKGKNVFDSITNKERLHDFSKDKEQAFVDYYAFTFSEQYHTLISPYKSPTLRHTTYLVMRQMGLDDKTIRNLLNVSDSTIRNYRYRLQK